MALIVSLCACGKETVTMQGVYEAGLSETLLENHVSVYAQYVLDAKTRDLISAKGVYRYDDAACTKPHFASEDHTSDVILYVNGENNNVKQSCAMKVRGCFMPGNVVLKDNHS